MHVRVWQPTDSRLRPVVLLGELDDNEGRSVTNGVEDAATTVAAQLLGPDGLTVDWYQYWPLSGVSEREFHAVTFTVTSGPGSTRSRQPKRRRRAKMLGGDLEDPQWSDVSRETLEELVGEEIEVYPDGAYTKANATRFAVEGRFVFRWDPTGLEADVDAARSILESPGIGLDLHQLGVVVGLLLEDDQKRVHQNRKNANAQPRGLAVELDPYTPNRADLERLRASVASTRNGLTPDATFAELTDCRDHLRRWLSENGPETDRMLLVPGVQGLAWLEPWEVGLDDGDFETEDDTVNAVRHVERRLSTKLYEFDGDQVADFPLVVPSEPLDATGPWARRYLETVSWWGPKQEDALRTRRLVAQLEKGPRYVAGYDPWGRLVLKQGKTFVVEWPLGPRPTPPPDEALIVGNSSSKASAPVFIRLADSRLDLLPAPTDRSGGTSYTWGYGGGGPFTFAQAIRQLIAAGPTSFRGFGGPIDDVVVGWKSAEFRKSVGELRSLGHRPRREGRNHE